MTLNAEISLLVMGQNQWLQIDSSRRPYKIKNKLNYSRLAGPLGFKIITIELQHVLKTARK